MLRPYKECIHAITPHGKGLGVGASVRTLPGAGKERMFERSEFLAPAANGFVRIAPETQPLIFFFVTFFLHQGKKESEWIHGHGLNNKKVRADTHRSALTLLYIIEIMLRFGFARR
jgi:hypothetical protein